MSPDRLQIQRPPAAPRLRGVARAIDGATPHILDFPGIANATPGRKSPSCGAR